MQDDMCHIYIYIYSQGSRDRGLEATGSSHGDLGDFRSKLFWHFAPRQNKSENSSQGIQQTVEIDFNIIGKTTSVTSWFLQYIPCQNLPLGTLGVQSSMHNSMHRVSWIEPEKKEPFVLGAQKTDSGIPRVLSVAPIVSQGAPTVPQMISQGTRTEVPDLPSGSFQV